MRLFFAVLALVLFILAAVAGALTRSWAVALIGGGLAALTVATMDFVH